MADQAVDNEADVEAGDGELPPKTKRWSGKRIVLFIVLPVLLVLGAGAGVYFSGILGGHEAADEAAKEAEAAQPPAPGVFYDLPDLLVNLNTSGKRTSFLKLKVSLELGKPTDVPILESVLPRVIDNFQVYLRELRAEDLRGSAGLYRLREELLMRVRTAAQPAEVKDVLFKEMLIQ
ncbi:MAG: flagellar basal body-associated FliL family protein [Alphaproteobacteria bacterium]